MNKTVKVVIIVLLTMISIAVVSYFSFIKEYTPTEVYKNEMVSDSTQQDSTSIDTVVYDEASVDTSFLEFVDSYDTIYYIVVGSFKYEVNAIGFLDSVDNSSIIYNDSYHMVYIYKTDDLTEAINIRISNKDSYDGVWIYNNVD